MEFRTYVNLLKLHANLGASHLQGAFGADIVHHFHDLDAVLDARRACITMPIITEQSMRTRGVEPVHYSPHDGPEIEATHSRTRCQIKCLGPRHDHAAVIIKQLTEIIGGSYATSSSIPVSMTATVCLATRRHHQCRNSHHISFESIVPGL